MLKTMVLPGLVTAGLLAACSSTPAGPTANIGKVTNVKSSFGPEFQVKDVPTTGIDPKMLEGQKLPQGLKFDPADCEKFAAGQAMPTDLKGNMAAVSAEGNGNRFIVLALETSKPVTITDPGDTCKKVSYVGGAVQGTIEEISVPQIADVTTVGVHRVIKTTINGKPQTGEIFSYRAQFGNYQVIVTANPLVLPDKPVVPVDTKRAESLLTAAVAAIKQPG